MPARDQKYRCFCSLCSEVDIEGVARRPEGKLIPQRFRSIHLGNVQLLQQDDVSSNARRIAVESLLRDELVGIPPRRSGDTVVDDLTAAIGQMTLTPSEGPSQHLPGGAEVIGEATATSPLSKPSVVEKRSPPKDGSPSLQESSFLSKQERNRRTLNSHKVLDSIEARVQFISRQSLCLSSVETQRRLVSEVQLVKDRLSCVNRKVPSVMTRKNSILHSCIEVEARLDSTNTPRTPEGSIKYDSCSSPPH
ncbi:hypothetical protein JVU11DRAFT_3280 [Chiua virens]|nr:hypothetical protein JVU11DRAFT_3280 [Chiua virens]